jgi:hypothetical protein
MNISTLKKIELAAPFLSTSQARITKEYLQSPYQLCLSIFEVLSDGESRTCKDIASLIPAQRRRGVGGEATPSWESINQILLALQKGGIEFVQGIGTPEQRTWKLPNGKVFMGK